MRESDTNQGRSRLAGVSVALLLVAAAGKAEGETVLLKNGKQLEVESIESEREWSKMTLKGGGSLVIRNELIAEIVEETVAVVKNDAREAETLQRWRVPRKYMELIERHASELAVDPNLVTAVIKAESNFDEKAVSKKGAMGLMQLTAETAELYRVDDPFDPCENIRAGSEHLKKLIDKYDDLELALAAYNAGDGRISYYGGIPPFSETKNYVKKVIKYYHNLKKEGEF